MILSKLLLGEIVASKAKSCEFFPHEGRLTVERMNMVKRHTRPTRQMQQGGIIEREGKLHISNVMLICSKCERGVRIGHRILENEKKVRICRRCGELLDK